MPTLLIRQRGNGSWFDRASVPILSYKLQRRLEAATVGRRGVFITLTYRRGEYENAEHLYDVASEKQHVPIFMRKLARALGESFAGRWFCKMEFQRGGWIHWHILLLDRQRIEHKLLERTWGHGHVWIDRFNASNAKATCAYLAKYLAKAGDCPAWIYLRPTRSVKVVRVSPGFWGDTEGSDDCDDSSCKPARLTAYVSIGQALDRSRGRVVVAFKKTQTSDPVFNEVECDMGVLCAMLRREG